MPTITLGPDILKKGLRPTKRNPRNSGYLIESKGAVGRDGVLQAIDELTSMLTSATHILNFDAQTGSFTVGNTITGATSGATAVIEAVDDRGSIGTLSLSSVSGTFQDDEIIYESAVGSELIINGDCSSDSFNKGTGWVYDAVNNEYDCDGSQVGSTELTQTAILVSGRFYKTVLTIKNYFAGSAFVRLGASGAGQTIVANGTYTDYILSTGTNFKLRGDISFIASTDDISCKIITNTALANGAVTAIATDTFPFPQLFVGTNHIIVCYQTDIYEWCSDALVLKITASAAGSTWTCEHFYDYIYLSNGQVSIERHPQSNAYAETTLIPTAMSSCNFNGQVLLGAPDVDADGADLVALDGIITVTVTPIGSIL